MIRKIKLYIALVAVLLSASSCLDKYPQDAIPQDDAIKTVSDVRQALIGIYAQFKNSSLYSGYLTLLPDIQTDQVYAVKGYTLSINRWNMCMVVCMPLSDVVISFLITWLP